MGFKRTIRQPTTPFGFFIYNILETRKISLYKLAKLTGISYAVLYKTYIGTTEPRQEVLIGIARYLGRPVAQVFSGDKPDVPVRFIIDESAKAWVLLEHLQKIPDNRSRFVDALIDFITEDVN